MMNAMALLLTSRGIPMIVMGDEVGRSQHGNNNAYCLDSSISWLDWRLFDSNQSLHDFTKALIHFRLKHPALRVNSFENKHTYSIDLPGCSFHGTNPWNPNWDENSKQLAWMMTSEPETINKEADVVYVAANMAHYASWYELPEAPKSYQWMLNFNTGDSNCQHLIYGCKLEQKGLLVGERSVTIITASKINL